MEKEVGVRDSVVKEGRVSLGSTERQPRLGVGTESMPKLDDLLLQVIVPV